MKGYQSSILRYGRYGHNSEDCSENINDGQSGGEETSKKDSQ